MTQDRCKSCDFGVFLALWNISQNYKTPTIHFRIATWLQKCWERGHRRLLLQAFRASGKSTIAAIFCAWILYRDPDLRILVLSAESNLAQKMARTVRKVVERHPLTKTLRPDRPDDWAADSFTVRRTRISRDPSVLARGLYANITGIRADIIICDDVEVPNTCDTPEKREALRDRLLENEFILTPSGTILYIGTPHTYFSIYAKMPRPEIGEDRIFLKGYRRKTIPVLNRAGNSAWPERYSTAQIEDMRSASGAMKFSSQMMLEPVNIMEGRLDVASLKRYAGELVVREAQNNLAITLEGQKIVSASAWWDPSFGKMNGDGSVLAVVFTDEEGRQYLHRVVYIKIQNAVEDDMAAAQCNVVANVARDLCLPVIAVETNGVGKFLPAILRKSLAALGLATAVVEKTSHAAKAVRILESFDVAMAAKILHVHASVYKTPFITEMAEWRPDVKGMRDDGLDAAAGALSLGPMRIKRIYAKGTKFRIGDGKNFSARTDFDV